MQITSAVPHQDEVGLVGGQHEDGDDLLSQWGDDRLGNLCDAHRLRAAGSVAIGDHVEWQPGGTFYLQVL